MTDLFNDAMESYMSHNPQVCTVKINVIEQKENIMGFDDLDFEMPTTGWVKSTSGILLNVQNICAVYTRDDGLTSTNKKSYRIVCAMTGGAVYNLAEIEIEAAIEEFSKEFKAIFKK